MVVGTEDGSIMKRGAVGSIQLAGPRKTQTPARTHPRATRRESAAALETTLDLTAMPGCAFEALALQIVKR